MIKKKGVILGCAAVVILAVTCIVFNIAGPSSKTAVLQFIRENSDKVSLEIIRNGEELLQYHADKSMPLASVAKILLDFIGFPVTIKATSVAVVYKN